MTIVVSFSFEITLNEIKMQSGRMMQSERLRGTFWAPSDRSSGFGYSYFSRKLADASKQLARRHIFTGRNEVLAKVIFSQACVCPQGGGACSKFLGGACSKFSGGVPAPKFRGGACSKFSGGCLLQIFLGGPAPKFWGGACSKFSGGSPIFGIRSTFGRYASYWNAFLL